MYIEILLGIILIWLLGFIINLIHLAVMTIILMRRHKLDLRSVFYEDMTSKCYISSNIEQEIIMCLLYGPVKAIAIIIGSVLFSVYLLGKYAFEFVERILKRLKFNYGFKSLMKLYIGFIEKKGMRL